MDLLTCADMKKMDCTGTGRVSYLSNQVNCGRAEILGAQVVGNT